MIEVKFFGTARLDLKFKELSINAADAATIGDLLRLIAAAANVPPSKAKQYLVYVNEVNIDKLKRFRTTIKDGDKVMILSPSSGG